MKASKIVKVPSVILVELLVLLATQIAFSQDKNSGDYLDEYMDVVAKSNGGDTGTGDGTWQCVDYVKRFYGETTSSGVFGLPFGQVGTADQMFDKALSEWSDKFFAYPNDGEVPPITGDILCFDGAGVGHVAIVTYVNLQTGKIGVIEQNWNRNSATRDLDIVKNADKTYSVTFSSTQGYYIEGWVRAKKMVVGQYEAEPKWRSEISQPIAECYNRNGGLEAIGKPYNDGSGIYVHLWQPYSDVLVQNFDGGSWGNCSIVYNPLLQKAFALHGGFWQVYRYNDGPGSYGVPITDEYLGSDGNTYQDFSQGLSLKWDGSKVSSVATADLRRLGIISYGSLTSPDVFMALIPGDGSVLNLLAYAKSADSIVVSGSWILGAVRYQVFREGQYAGDLDANLNFVDSGLVSATAYRYYLVALGSFGRTLTTSLEVSATTMAQNLI